MVPKKARIQSRRTENSTISFLRSQPSLSMKQLLWLLPKSEHLFSDKDARSEILTS